MAETFLLQGSVKWSFDFEMAEFSSTYKVMTCMVSFTPPLHRHKGNIALSTTEIIIEGLDDDEDLSIPLSAIKEVYLGFDDLFPVTSVKSLGIMWQPLRIEYSLSAVETQSVYLVIDFNGLYTHDKAWFETLKELLQ